ncbi:calcium-binding protein [Aliiroseovarius subalbicans]|uniref:calcium-binding protein n=1 Tax=Aliiroseovarius subalbicans TaxID=2925840 RepID=UPI001F55D2FA|nr:calcium-binding protein [Aliiroseovarius subalbicans]MCI2399807.1 calcium-binding protein [Aliiroseovarius subalbicans]
MPTLLATINTRPDTEIFANLVALVDANTGANLSGALSGGAGLSAFIPTDAAMIAAAQSMGFTGSDEAGAQAYLIESATLLGQGDPWAVLAGLLAYHITGDAPGAAMTTLSGASLSLVGGVLTDNDPDTADAGILETAPADNGTFNLVDGVLVPEDVFASNGAADVQVVVGADNADNIATGNDDDFVNGNGGSDNITTNGGDDTVLGEGGNDTISTGGGNDFVSGGTGHDVIDGGNNNDTLFGDNGDDTILGGEGADTIDGGNDDDTLSGGDGGDDIQGGNGEDVLNGDGGSDTLSGDAGNDTLNGGSGMDTLNGGEGNDMLAGGSGNDTFVFAGNVGSDTITDFSDGSDVIDVSALGIFTTNQLVFTQIGGDVVIGFGNGKQVTVLGIDAGDLDASDFVLDTPPPVVGTGSADVLHLTGGDDTVDAGDGSDKVYGYDGNDDITAGAGEDYVDGGEGNDVIDAGSGKDQVKGGAGNDTIFGMASNDLLFGQDGNDMINGGANNDRIYGGNGGDTLIGEHGNDKIWGDAGSDTLIGGAGKDVMDGGSGNDILIGGKGDDKMTGGSGADVFVFEDDRTRADTIMDFQDGTDLLDVVGLGITDVSELNMAQVGADVVITLSDRDVITLKGVDMGDLDNSDFILADPLLLG